MELKQESPEAAGQTTTQKEASPPATGGVPFGAAPPTPIPISPPEMVAVRRRRKRRRSRSDKAETPQRRLYIALLLFVMIMLAVTMFGGVGKAIVGAARGTIPRITSGLRLEVVALFVAALILVYLMPGMEDRILRFLGLRRDKRR